jgi:hypothetical protein
MFWSLSPVRTASRGQVVRQASHLRYRVLNTLSSDLFDMLDDLQLVKPRSRVERLLQLRVTDLERILDRLDAAVLPPDPSEVVESIWLPFPTDDVLNRLPNYALFFDRVYTVDPLFDLFAALVYPETDEGVIDRVIEFSDRLGVQTDRDSVDSTALDRGQEYATRRRHAAALRLDSVIRSYVTNRDLLQRRIVVPYHTTQPIYTNDVFQAFFVRLMFHLMPEDSKLRMESGSATRDEISSALSDAFGNPASADRELDLSLSFLTAWGLKQFLPAGSSIDMGGDSSRRLIDSVLRVAGDILGKEIATIRGVQWPQAGDEIIVPMLAGVTAHDVMLLRAHEPAALEQFRADLHEMLDELRASSGVEDYPRLISTIRRRQKRKELEIAKLAEHIRRDHLRKLTQHVSVALFSAAATALTASANMLDPLHLVAMGAGSAGVLAAVSGLMQTWVSHSAAIDSLSLHPAYVVWRLRKGLGS